jgi:K+-sensing histidine kinase KdpD
MVAHDLRSPLSVVTLSAHVLNKMMMTLEAGRPARKLVQGYSQMLCSEPDLTRLPRGCRP